MKNIILFIAVITAFAKAYSQEISPQTSVVDIQEITAILDLDFDNKAISGEVTVAFKMLQDVKKILLDAKNMTVVPKNTNADITITTTEKHIQIQGKFKKGSSYQIQFDYKVVPQQAAYFVVNGNENQFWTQGQGKYTSHWLPSIDDMNDKILFNLTVETALGVTVAGSGKGKASVNNDTSIIYQFDMQHPISSYLVGLVVGNYESTDEVAASGILLEYYYYTYDTPKFESTYRHSKEIFDFLEGEIGVPFPFQVYKQVPVKDFLYAGMENASCTIFSDQFVTDAIGFTDRNYVNVNAHELAHQWFGDLVTETKSDHHWLHEGFATYYALLAEREIFGDDYFYFKLFETAEQLRELSDKGKGQKLVAAGGSSLTYYQKGAWAIHILKEKVGDEVFKKAVESYLTKYAYQNVTTDDFMAEIEAITTIDLTGFKKNWLYQGAFQADDALQSLKKSEFMQQYFQLQSGRSVPISSKFTQLMDAVNTDNDYLGQEAIYQISQESINAVLPIYKNAMAGDNVYIRQAIATSLESIPENLVIDFYALLDDSSYVTREQAMIKLWEYYLKRNDPKSQRKVLDLMDDTFGFADGNIRTLWLTLSLATPDYKPALSGARYQELIDYTTPENPYQLRENAFRYLQQLGAIENLSLHSLVEASVHHVWRFRENSRKLLDIQLKNPETISLIQGMKASFSKKELAYLKRIEVF